MNESEGDGRLTSITNFYDGPGQKDTLNQESNSNGNLRSYNARAVYTEPLFKRSLMEFSVGKSNSRSRSDITTYDFNRQTKKFDDLNDLQTNDYRNDYGFTNAGVRVRTQMKKYNYAIGVTWQQAGLDGKVVSGQSKARINAGRGVAETA